TLLDPASSSTASCSCSCSISRRRAPPGWYVDCPVGPPSCAERRILLFRIQDSYSPDRGTPQATPQKERTHEKDVPADRRGAGRDGSCRRDRRSSSDGNAGRDREDDPPRRDLPAERARVRLCTDPRRHGRVLLLCERPG